MDILDFYKRLSSIVDNYDNNGRTKSTSLLKQLLKEAKDAELDVDISANLFQGVEIFFEESSYEEENSYSSYDDEDEDSSY